MTTPSYYVTVDSEYRDYEKYPIPTDFSVKFKNTNTGLNLLGLPYGPTGTSPSELFFTPLQIDPDYFSSNFRVKNGEILNLKKLPDNTFILCGLISPLPGVQEFEIYNDTTSFVVLNGLTFGGVFLCNISFVNGQFGFNWIIYSQSPSANETNRSTFELDENNNIYFLFDFTTYFDLKIKSSTNSAVIYGINNPTPTKNSCLASFAFTLSGDTYYVDGHSWGYHIISSNDDIKSTKDNGRFNVLLDNALNIYVSGNTNPYDPTLIQTTMPYQAGANNNFNLDTGGGAATYGPHANTFQVIEWNGNKYFIGLEKISGGYYSTMWTITENGLNLLHDDIQNPGGEFINYNSKWLYVVGNTAYFVLSQKVDPGSRWWLNSIDLTTGIPQYNIPFTGVFIPTNIYTGLGACVTAYYENAGNRYIYVFQMYAPSAADFQLRFQVWRIDLNNIAGGFSFQLTTSLSGYTYANPSQTVGFLKYPHIYIEGETVWLTNTNDFAFTDVWRFAIDPMTFNIAETDHNGISLNINKDQFLNYQIKQGSKYYLIIPSVKGQETCLILDITNPSNMQKVSFLNNVDNNVYLYENGGRQYIVNTKGVVYDVTNIINPLLLSSAYPNIATSLSPYVFNVVDVNNNPILVGSQILNSTTWNLFTVPFLNKNVVITSTQYNQNLQNYLTNPLAARMDVINLLNFPYMAMVENNTRNLKVYNISNIQNPVLTSNITNVFDSNNDPNNFRNTVNLTFRNLKLMEHIITGNSSTDNIYIFLIFNVSQNYYLLGIKLDIEFNFIESKYTLLGIANNSFSSNLTGLPSQIDFDIFISSITPFIKDNKIYCVVQYIGNNFWYSRNRTFSIYEYTSPSITLTSTISNLFSSLPNSDSANNWWQTGGRIYQYLDGSLYFFAYLTRNDRGFSGEAEYYLLPINLDDVQNPIEKTGNALFQIFGGAMYTYASSIQKYPDNTIQLIGVAQGSVAGETRIYNITNPLNITFIETSTTNAGAPLRTGFPLRSLRGQSQGGFPDQGMWLGDNIYPITFYQNSVTGIINVLYAFNTTRTPTGQNYLGYRNINDINNITPNLGYISLQPTGSRIQYIKIANFNQRSYAVILLTTGDYYNMTSSSVYMVDISNLEYAFNFSSGTPIPVSQTYSPLYGCGLGFINKLDNEGISQWINYVGANNGTGGSGPFGSNVNISNIDIDPSLSYIYVAGGWQNKIETYNSSLQKRNLVTSNFNNSYNGFIAKVDLTTNGDIEWLLPSFGSSDITFQRLQYINSKNLVSFVCSYNTPIMQLFDIQTSGTGPYTNPITSQLNLANTSNASSALIVLTPSGKLSYSSRLYSDIGLRSINLFDLAVDENTPTDRSIKVVGLSNTEELKCIDSTGLNVQITYSKIDPLNQVYLVIYSYDLDGIYQHSDKVEFPIGMEVSVQDIKSFSLNNRVVTFPNVKTTLSNNDIYVYNKDGTLATIIDDIIPNVINSIIIQYYYDPTYVDVNNISYTKIVLQDSFNFTPESLINYNLFIQGDLFDSYTSPITQIAQITPLNKNFSIRHNFIENGKDVLILNQIIPDGQLVRRNLPSNDEYWAGNISPSELPGIIAYNKDQMPTTSLQITNLYGLLSIDTTKTWYLVFYNSSNEIKKVLVNSITFVNGLYTFNISNAADLLYSSSPDVYVGPYLYLTTINENSVYTLDFSPGTIYQKVYYFLQLNSLIIPNRRISTSFLPGTRSINDFRSIYLEVYNEDDNGNFDTSVVNNYFTNNQNFVSQNQRSKTLFEIPISGVFPTSDTNYVVLSGSNVPILVITPGYYNLHLRLVDSYNRIILFDPTPIDGKDSDIIFTGSTVDNRLIQITANFTFTLRK